MKSTLDTAAEEAVSTLIDDPSDEEEESTETADSVAEKDAETKEIQEDSNSDSKEWKFSDIDPKTLPPELQDTYHNLNRGYTQGMQKKSEEIKQLRAELEQLKNQEPEQPTYKRRENVQKDFSQMTPYEFANYMRQQNKDDMKIDRENQYIETAEREFFAVDERLNSDSPTYDKFLLSSIVDQLGDLRHQFEQANQTIIGFDYRGETQRLIKEYDEAMAKKYKTFVATKQKQARQQSQKLAKSNLKSSSSQASKSRNMTVAEAAEKAFDEASI